jgi:hypothetical protein
VRMGGVKVVVKNVENRGVWGDFDHLDESGMLGRKKGGQGLLVGLEGGE